MQIRPVGKWLICDNKVIASCHHSQKTITIIDKSYITQVHSAYPKYKITIPKDTNFPAWKTGKNKH